MKYIHFPAAILPLLNIVDGEQIRGPKTKEHPDGKPVVVDAGLFVRGRLTDMRFAKTMSGIMSAVKIFQQTEQMDKGPLGPVLAIEDSDYELLKDAVMEPTHPYDTNFAFSTVPFMKAVVDAKDEPPATDDGLKEAAE